MVQFLVSFPHMPEEKVAEMRLAIDQALARLPHSLHLSVDRVGGSAEKPTRSEFRITVIGRYPGATCIAADRGLTIVVGDEGVAASITAMAEASGLKVATSADLGRTEEVMVRVFGFPRRKE